MEQIVIEVSARHCHLSQKDLNTLFGVNYELTFKKAMSQTGQFAAQEIVTLRTETGEINNLRILGPVREKTQIELSMTDARKLGIKPPLRLSGDLRGSVGGTVIGPKGTVRIKEGIIIAKRHIHCDLVMAKKMSLTEKSLISVKTPGNRSVIFEDVEVRINKNFKFFMHIDTDEGNASLPDGVCSKGQIIITTIKNG
ncbi:MAG: phosphate propanoyltransferase [Candidatus Buchananbacteria bacterium]